MTNERAITIIDDVNAYLASRSIYKNDSIAGYTYRVICQALTQLKQSALEAQQWIPVSDPLNELPKDRTLYVTTKFGDVETLFWDMTEWSDDDIARCTVAYMDYYEPEPYKAESDKECKE